METGYISPRVLGRSGLHVGRLGFGSSFGAPARSYEQAFEKGCNYFYWGSLRRAGMAEAIRHLAVKDRDNLVVVLQSYSRYGWMVNWTVESGLRHLKLDVADVLLLGWHNSVPSPRLMEAACRVKEKGRVRHLAVSAHHRPIFRQFLDDSRIDILMVRYNAAHRGAESEVFDQVADHPGAEPGLVSYTATRWRTLIDRRHTPRGMKTPTATDCYRFALSHPMVDVCLCGPASAEQMDAGLEALERGPLSDEEMAWMRAVGDHVHRVTARTSANPFMQRVQ